MGRYVCSASSIIFGVCLAVLGAVLGFYAFPIVINFKIDESVKLVTSSSQFERWEVTPLPLQFKMYFFNISNPEEVQKGAKPIVKEVGPYIYNEERHKYNITVHNDTFAYYQDQLFSFNEEASKPLKENDTITIGNLPLLSIIAMVDLKPGRKTLLRNLNKAIPTLFHDPKDIFLTTTVKSFLFDGVYIACNEANPIESLACQMIMREAPIQLQEQEDKSLKFSLLSYKNNTHDGHYLINSGGKEIKKLGQILTWKDSSEIENWKENSTCRKLYGTDTTIFSPHKSDASSVDVFQSDICRTVNLKYREEIKYKNIGGRRFVLGSDELSSEECYCTNKTRGITAEDGCLLDGAMELFACLGVPIVMTFPHFYSAHPNYTATVSGLTPDKLKHQTFVDLEPKSGTVIRGSKRVQFNLFLRKIDYITLTENLTDSLLPILWIDEGVELDDKHINLLYESLFLPLTILQIVYWSLIAVGIAIGFMGPIWCLCCKKGKNYKDTSNSKIVY